MKPSDLWKLVHVAELFSLLKKGAGMIAGADITSLLDDKDILLKGLSGIFGTGDEKALYKALSILLRDHVGYSDVLFGFFKWHFKSKTTGQKVASWWHGNAFRKFATNMEEADAVQFLVWMVDVINLGPTTLKGYKKLVERLEILAIPHYQKGTADAVDRILKEISGVRGGLYRNAKAGFIRNTRATERMVRENALNDRSFLDKLINWI